MNQWRCLCALYSKNKTIIDFLFFCWNDWQGFTPPLRKNRSCEGRDQRHHHSWGHFREHYSEGSFRNKVKRDLPKSRYTDLSLSLPVCLSHCKQTDTSICWCISCWNRKSEWQSAWTANNICNKPHPYQILVKPSFGKSHDHQITQTPPFSTCINSSHLFSANSKRIVWVN